LPRIPDQLLHSVVYFYLTARDAENASRSGGTGFFVDVRSQVTKQPFRYVITNRHVAHNCGFLRLNTADGGTDVLEIPSTAWVDHPDGDDISAAAVAAPDPNWAATALEWDSFVGSRQFSEARMKELNVGVGDDVFMLGRFIAHGGRQQNQPLARFGNIAMMPGEPVLDGRGLHVEAFLVEMRSLAGFSGSPVFVYIGPGTYRGDGRMMPFYSENIGLIGIDTGHKILTSPVIDETTKKPVDPPCTVVQNSGVAIVAPVWKIRDVLDEEEFVEQRKEADREWLERHGAEEASSDVAADENTFTRADFEDALKKVSRRIKPSPPAEGTSGT
jgi:hypothetical protein